MKTRKTNLGVEYELEAYETGRSSVKVLAYFPNSVEQESFEIKGLSKEMINHIDITDDLSGLTDTQLLEAQQFINEQAIMYVSMELAKLMGEGKCKRFSISSDQAITATVRTSNSIGHCRSGLPQIEELIKKIRYSK